MEFVRGAKLNSLPPAEIRALVKVGMDVFLAQLLVIGFMHSDPHPGNLLKVDGHFLHACSAPAFICLSVGQCPWQPTYWLLCAIPHAPAGQLLSAQACMPFESCLKEVVRLSLPV